MVEPARLLHRCYAFGVDTFLLLAMVTAVTALTPLNILEDSFIYAFFFGVYRVVLEFFTGNTFGKALLHLRVCYFDQRHRERRDLRRLFAVLLRNSWLLVAGFSWLLESDSDLRNVLVILALVMAAVSYRTNRVSRNFGASVLQVRTVDPWEDAEL